MNLSLSYEADCGFDKLGCHLILICGYFVVCSFIPCFVVVCPSWYVGCPGLKYWLRFLI